MFPLHVLSVDGDGQILGHDSVFVNDLNTCVLQVKTPISQSIIPVELGAVEETTGPGEDGRDGVCGSLVALLPFTVMASYGSYHTKIESARVATKGGK